MKLSAEDLTKLLKCIPQDDRVVVPPKVGFDAGVHRLGDKLMIVATDPCTGVPEEWFGWLLVNYAASDLALFGAKPEFCTITLMGPRSTKPEKFQEIMSQVCAAACELGTAIVRGHTATYDSLSDLAGVCTTYGTIEPNRLITPADAKPDDLILCTKPIGLETAINFTLTHKSQAQKLFGKEAAKDLAGHVRLQSCVQEAMGLAEAGVVHAMHDATEGGFAAALNELAEASQLGFKAECEKVPLTREVRLLQEAFGLSDEQVLAMSSTGTILAAVDPKDAEKAEESLKCAGLHPSFVGKFTEQKSRILLRQGKAAPFPRTADDPYAKLLLGKP